MATISKDCNGGNKGSLNMGGSFSNIKGSTNTSSSARFYLDTIATSAQYGYLTFPSITIPSGAKVDSVKCTIRCVADYNVNNVKIHVYLAEGTTRRSDIHSKAVKGYDDIKSITVTATSNFSAYNTIRLYFGLTGGDMQSYEYPDMNVYGATVTVTYTQYYNVVSTKYSSNNNVTISPSGTSSIAQNGSYTITVTNTSNIAPKVTDNGTQVSLTGTASPWKYTISKVTAAHTINVYQPFTITASENPDTAITLNPTSKTVYYNNSYTLTISNATSRPKIKDNNADVVTSNTSSTNNTWTYTLSKVTANHTIVVSPGTTIWYKNSSGWIKGSKLYIKTSSGWQPATHIYIKTSSTTWTQKL